MKKTLTLVLAASCLATAQIRPVIDLQGGFAFPKITGSSADEQAGWAFRVGAGAAIPVNPQFDILLTGGFGMANAGSEDSEDGNTTTITLTPRFIDIDGTALWKASPQFGLMGGLVMTIPIGGTYEYEFTSEDYPQYNESEDGDIDDLADLADADINNFMSLKIGGQYMLGEKNALTLSYLLPMGKYFDGDGFSCEIARLMAGVQFAL